jgi:hypothetical protein
METVKAVEVDITVEVTQSVNVACLAVVSNVVGVVADVKQVTDAAVTASVVNWAYIQARCVQITTATCSLREPDLGFNRGRYNVDVYSKRHRYADLTAKCVQRTTGTVVIDGKLVDLVAHIYQTTPCNIRVDFIGVRDVVGRIIQTEPTFCEWDVFPPFDIVREIKQTTPVSIAVGYYTPIVYLNAAVSQTTPVVAKATTIFEAKPSCQQFTPVVVNATPGGVADFIATCVQTTVFVPGVVVGWTPWYPINPDYPVPWDRPAQEAA